jgi:hypothetical protein
MSSQKKLINEILSSYETINNNKKFVSEVTDTYNNIEFRNIGLGNPATDNINTSLLSDIQTAARSAGLNVSVTTAITGHKKGTRHETGNAVDIAMINGKAVSASNRADADKLVAALVSMGYTKNSEGPNNPKAVLTFGFPGHDNHVHVSNTGGVSTQQPSTTNNTTQTTDDTQTSDTTQTSSNTSSRSFVRQVGGELLRASGIQEAFKPGMFGDSIRVKDGKVFIPRNSNSKIKSPVSGELVDVISNKSCVNQIVIEYEDGFLEYCGITKVSDKLKKRVGVGTVLGVTNSNVTVTYYSQIKTKKPIVLDDKKPSKTEKEKDDSEDRTSNNEKHSSLFVNIYRDLKKSFDTKKGKKIEENINRIKGLL